MIYLKGLNIVQAEVINFKFQDRGDHLISSKVKVYFHEFRRIPCITDRFDLLVFEGKNIGDLSSSKTGCQGTFIFSYPWQLEKLVFN